MSDECHRFTRYLCGVRPSRYVREWYEAGHARSPGRFAPEGRLDRLLLTLSGLRWVPLTSLDMTARVIAPGAAVRRKLVFLTAILENAPETWERYETPSVRSPAAFYAGLAWRGLVIASALATGLVVVGLSYAAGIGAGETT